MKRTMGFLAVCAGGLVLLARPAYGQVTRDRGGPPDRPEAAREAPSAREQALAQQVRALQEQLKRIEETLAKAQARPDPAERGRPQARPDARAQAGERDRVPAGPVGDRRPPAGPLGPGFMGRPGMRRGEFAPQPPGGPEGRPEARPMGRRPGPQAVPPGPWAGGGRWARGREASRPWDQSGAQPRAPFAGRFREGPQPPERPAEYGRFDRPLPAGGQGIAVQVRQLVEDARRLLAAAERLEKQVAGSGGPEQTAPAPRRPMRRRGQ